jgi:hypothetical protein
VAVLMFALGVIAGWAALVLGWVAYWDLMDAPDSERAGILAVMFGIGPLVGLVTGTITAALVRQRVWRTDTARTQAGLPARRWPAALRCLFGVVLGFVGGFVVAAVAMRFTVPALDAPENASAALHLLPVGIALLTAFFGGWRGLRSHAA